MEKNWAICISQLRYYFTASEAPLAQIGLMIHLDMINQTPSTLHHILYIAHPPTDGFEQLIILIADMLEMAKIVIYEVNIIFINLYRGGEIENNCQTPTQPSPTQLNPT